MTFSVPSTRSDSALGSRSLQLGTDDQADTQAKAYITLRLRLRLGLRLELRLGRRLDVRPRHKFYL